MQNDNVIEFRKELRTAKKLIAKQAAERLLAIAAAEKAIQLKADLELRLDVERKHREELERTVLELRSQNQAVVDPVVVELVPENIRKRMAELNRRLAVYESGTIA